jgi:hypothetical protein
MKPSGEFCVGSGNMKAICATIFAGLLLVLAPSEGPSQESKRVVRPSYVILHDVFGKSPTATPTYIRQKLEFLESQPVDGLAIYVRTADLSVNVTMNVVKNELIGYDLIARALAPIKGLHFRRLSQNFAVVITRRPPDFFSDWSNIVTNFADLARAAREVGLKGIFFDNENYEAPWANYPEGVAHREKSLREYQDQARLRGKEIMQAMVREFPEIVAITLHGPYSSESKAPEPLFPGWYKANGLLGPFFTGFVEGAGKQGLCVDGGELYYLRTEEEFQKSYAWRKTTIASDGLNCGFIPPAVRALWQARVSVGFGLTTVAFRGKEMTPEIFRSTLARALTHTDRYVWVFPENVTFLKPPEDSGADVAWVTAIRRGREDAEQAIRSLRK